MKIQLSVRNFSCIESADIELLPITILIGPQASGKSVLSKLIYFCNDAIRGLTYSMYAEETLTVHKRGLIEKFTEWFPPTAWGSKSFSVELKFSDYAITIQRKRVRKEPSAGLSIVYPDYLEAFYSDFLLIMKDTSVSDEDQLGTAARRKIDAKSKLSNEFDKQLFNRLGISDRLWQTFIPAGRSFFTSQFKSSSLGRTEISEPILSEFGGLYAFVKDHGFPGRRGKRDEDVTVVRAPVIRELLGGDIVLDKEFPALSLADGRTLPFAYMSSGQQELLPLLLTLELFGVGPGNTTYIEEPEAHLFPGSQSILLKHLVSLIDLKTDYPQLFMTTHSPYILARLNNLIKAGQLGSSKTNSIRSKVADVIPARAWISPGKISAYAIEHSKTRNIIDEDGFVDGEYLDEVSEDISRELSALIQIEIDADLPGKA